VLVFVGVEIFFSMRGEEGQKTGQRSIHKRLECVLEKGSGRQAALAKKWEILNRARWR